MSTCLPRTAICALWKIVQRYTWYLVFDRLLWTNSTVMWHHSVLSGSGVFELTQYLYCVFRVVILVQLYNSLPAGWIWFPWPCARDSVFCVLVSMGWECRSSLCVTPQYLHCCHSKYVIVLWAAHAAETHRAPHSISAVLWQHSIQLAHYRRLLADVDLDNN